MGLKLCEKIIGMGFKQRRHVVCIYGSAIDSLHDKQGNETEMVAMKAGRDTSSIIMNKWLINQIDIKCWH